METITAFLHGLQIPLILVANPTDIQRGIFLYIHPSAPFFPSLIPFLPLSRCFLSSLKQRIKIRCYPSDDRFENIGATCVSMRKLVLH
jgi:hypothetical protein